VGLRDPPAAEAAVPNDVGKGDDPVSLEFLALDLPGASILQGVDNIDRG
jgi:hypothetical protein